MLHDLHREGAVVYVMKSQSLLDYLYFNYLALQRGLPLSRYANGVRTEFLGSLATLLRTLWARRAFRRATGRWDICACPTAARTGGKTPRLATYERTFTS